MPPYFRRENACEKPPICSPTMIPCYTVPCITIHYYISFISYAVYTKCILYCTCVDVQFVESVLDLGHKNGMEQFCGGLGGGGGGGGGSELQFHCSH